jgi:hypothetical protein
VPVIADNADLVPTFARWLPSADWRDPVTP